MRGPQTQNGWTAGEKGRRFLASLDPAVKVSYFQNEFMKSSFLPKYE